MRCSAVALIVLVMNAIVPVQAADWPTVKVAVEGAYPPFSIVEPDGSYSGFDIDIAEALCAEIQAECTLVQQDWDGMIPALLARRFDAIVASMAITEERKKKIAFTDKYYKVPRYFARAKGSGIEITPEGVKGLKIGVQRGTNIELYVAETYDDTVDIRRYATFDDMYLDAAAGRVDLIIGNVITLEQGFFSTEGGKNWEPVGPNLDDPYYFGIGAGIAVRQGDEDLRQLFDDAIKAIRADGTYERIRKAYFDFDIYGEPTG